ncbi:MAG: hypothetical protein R3181_07795, partial [Rubricoccaceae bacterium]|nr:hypothetical protein [Rubricoccaceae bacterium]
YVGDVLPVVAAEVPIDLNGDAIPDTLVRHVVTTRGPGNRGIPGPPGQQGVAWTMEAKPGFASDRVREDTGEPNDRIALSTDPETWPTFWPDQPTWTDPGTGFADWNGFFGRDQFNADLETYFWTDDNNDRALQTRYGFEPDSTRPGRGGLGLEMKVRGLQWSQFLAQDAIFWLYEITNSSTTTYDRVSVGLTVGTLAGGDGDSQDDLAFFDQANRIVYSWDFDDSGNEGQPVGYVGYGFLESPGNPDNGIDDDGDGDPFTDLGLDVDGIPYVDPTLAGQANVFTVTDFEPRALMPGDPLILIDAETGERSIEYVPDSGSITVTSQGRSYTVQAGTTLEERQITIEGQVDQVTVTEKNLLDDDLDGIVDEDVTLHFERRAQEFSGDIVTLPSLRFVDYVGFAAAVRGRTPTAQDSTFYGLKNPLIDESRDNGIDDDGDWVRARDDVGADGLPGTGDAGEGDGVPSPGEPNFDALDVTESDQVGLSSFFYFTPSNAFPLSNSERVWEGMTPGFFTTNEELESQQAAGGIDGDFVFGSGYFSLAPGETLRFTLALVFGNDLEDITTNAITIQEIYDRNYQFARPPDRPTLNAIPGDGQVTLYWDSVAEQSVDPILGNDFQGYRIYKSTDPFFRDVETVTDAFGNDAIRVPTFLYDREDGIEGIYTTADPRVRGVPFDLGSDTGLRYSVVDTDVNNGQRYYYAITAYDSGSPDFFPAENDIPSSIREDGTVFTGPNVVEVVPNAPVAGFVEGRVEGEVTQTAGPGTGEVFAEVLDPMMLLEGAQYTVTFSGEEPAADSFFVARDGMPVAEGALQDAPATVFDGVRLVFNNDETRLDADSTGWADPSGLTDTFTGVINVVEWSYFGEAVPYDYEIRFDDDLVGQSIGGFRLGKDVFGQAPLAVEKETNFTVRNTTLDRDAEFVFYEPADKDGRFDAYGEFIFIYEDVDGERTPTFIVRGSRDAQGEPTGAFPGEGDVFTVVTRKPFSQRDRFVLSTTASGVDEAAAQEQLDRIRVVPNPYVAAASWERPLPPTVTSGRGERRIDFIHLPAEARVRIYNVRGALVAELRHDSEIDDGTVSWDLKTREGLEVAYGVYFYHVEAPGVGEKTGQLALIK